MKEADIVLPKQVKMIIDRITQAGYDAYAVGGCIRDVVIGKEPNDWDITTSAMPNAIKRIFRRTVDTGILHGTVTVLIDNDAYEVTTYRIDGEYEDNRRPKNVSYTSNLIEDLKRRDFTINAMAYNETKGLIDAFSGLEDINNRCVKCVGNANERFREDALRMLRAIRFSAQLSFSMEEKTIEGIKNNATLIKNISVERIRVELNKILISDNPDYIGKLYDLGLMAYIIPEFIPNISLKQDNPHHVYHVDEHIYATLKNSPPNEILRWTMFLHDIGKGYTKTVDEKGIGHFHGHVNKSVALARIILNRLKFDNKTKNAIIQLIGYHDYRIEPSLKNIRKAVNLIGDDLFLQYTEVLKADASGQNPKYLDERLEKINRTIAYYKELKAKKQCISIKELKVNGNDLISIGIKQGKEIGRILGLLLEYVLDEPSHNNREWLLKKASELKN